MLLSALGMTYRAEAEVDRKKCVHGLAYDPATQEGCVLCRRDPGQLESMEPLPATPTPSARAPRTVETVIVGIALAALVGGGIYLTARKLAADRAMTCEGADCPPPDPLFARESKCKNLEGSPGKCIELCTDRCPVGMVCRRVAVPSKRGVATEGHCVPAGATAGSAN